jgi:hypothetical protein
MDHNVTFGSVIIFEMRKLICFASPHGFRTSARLGSESDGYRSADLLCKLQKRGFIIQNEGPRHRRGTEFHWNCHGRYGMLLPVLVLYWYYKY